jgi:hypothetical protein
MASTHPMTLTWQTWSYVVIVVVLVVAAGFLLMIE